MKERFDPARRVWECPICGHVNTWNWDDGERASRLLSTLTRRHVPVYVCHGSAFDNVCGQCGTDFVRRDSPIRAECYTHEPPCVV